MPPKQKGQNTRGRDKIFRNAVEHVHIGVGHTVLGNLSVRLAAGPPPPPVDRRRRRNKNLSNVITVNDSTAAAVSLMGLAGTSSSTAAAAALLADRPAFYQELNQQMLTHTAKDFKQFRWEVVELCETRPLFHLNRYEIAGKLVKCLMGREGGSFGNKSKSLTAAVGGADATNRGEASEAFTAYATLTVAFARDLQADFLPFYDAFQQAVQAGLYDRHGNVIADMNRLQLVYSVQAAWCRELAPFWVEAAAADADNDDDDDDDEMDEEELDGEDGNKATVNKKSSSSSSEQSRRLAAARLVRSIVALYVRQLQDTKEYVRRLAAEWLAYLCRLCRPLTPLVCELAAAEVLSGFELQGVLEVRAAMAEAAREAGQDDDNEDNDDAENEGDGGEAAGGDVDVTTTTITDAAAMSRDVWSADRTHAFLSHELPLHPVLDGLSFFAAELLRGMRGAVSTAFERFYVKLLESFLLMDGAGRRRVAAQLLRSRETTMLVHDFFSDEDDDNDEEEGEEEAVAAAGACKASRAAAPRIHGVQWLQVFSPADNTHEESEEEEEAAGWTCRTPAAVAAAAGLVREMGSAAIRAAMDTVLEETKRHSMVTAAESGSDDEEEEEAKSSNMAITTATEGTSRPSHRLLRAVVLCLDGQSSQHTRILSSLLTAAHYFLWADRRELALLTDAAGKLRKGLATVSTATATTKADPSTPQKGRNKKGAARANDSNHKEDDDDDDGRQQQPADAEALLTFAGALLEMLYPLCASPYIAPSAAIGGGSSSSRPADAWLLELQKLFLPVAKDCVAAVAHIGYNNSTNTSSGDTASSSSSSAAAAAARLLLFAAAQDLLQKNFAFCLAEERRLGEEEHSARYGHTNPNEEEDSDDDDDGAMDGEVSSGRRSARRHRRGGNENDREGAYVDEDNFNNKVAVKSAKKTSKTTTAAAAACGKAATVVHSCLTPLALTLLHSICQAAWSAANRSLDANHTNNKPNAPHTAATSLSPSSTTVAVGLVDQAVLLARLALDRTRHMQSSPLQQLLRLVSQKAKQNKDASAAAARAGDALVAILEGLVARLVALAESTTAPVATIINSSNSNSNMTTVATTTTKSVRRFQARSLDWLDAALPLLGVVAAATAAGSTISAPTLKQALLAILRNIKAVSSSTAGTTPVAVAVSATYSLYAKISVLLVHMASGGTGGGGGKKSKKGDKDNNTATDAAHMRRESLEHLSETIAVLAKGFSDQQANSSTSSSNGSDGVAGMDDLTRVLPSDESRARLFHGAELLLGALLGTVGVDGSSLEEEGEAATATGANSKTATTAPPAQQTVTATTARVLAALSGLQDALSPATQRQLFEVILLESMTAPSQPLRILALRLLRLLCHPSYPKLRRHLIQQQQEKNTNNKSASDDGADASSSSSALHIFAGAGTVEPAFFDALLAAEHFNPLSQTGNLDGVRQALARIAFAAEAGTITDPLERVLLARAMIGLLYVKFADAWPIALKILAGLVRRERTTMLPRASPNAADAAAREHSSEDSNDDDDNHHRHQGVSNGSKRGGGGKILEPVVWDSVVCRYAHLLVFGDVLGTDMHSTGLAVTAATPSADNEDNDEEEEGEGVAASGPGMCYHYHIHFTDFQRHQKGELVSKAFSLAQYIAGTGAASSSSSSAATGSTGGFALINLAEDDDEVITWRSHAGSLLSSGGSGSSKNKSKSSASTDRATLARTFLSALAEMMTSSSTADRKLRLVDELVLELVALQRGEHPALLALNAAALAATGRSRRNVGGQAKKLEDRLVLAMQACAIAPSTALVTAQERRRFPAGLTAAIAVRNGHLTEAFLSYTSDTDGQLQRAAIDNLKRLKVEPFSTFHAQLVPYCDTTKALFHFLSSFHVETDIPPRDQPAYVAAALSIALPKLVANLPKERRKDQAVLRRRLMGFITHLSDRMAKSEQQQQQRSAVAASSHHDDSMAQVLDGLVQQLIFCRVGSAAQQQPRDATTTATVTTTVHRRRLLQPADFDFLGTWESWLRAAATGNRGIISGAGHCVRRLERLCRQLVSTVQLLDSLLHAVGPQFASYVPSCLHLALQGYLVACKGLVKERLDATVEGMRNAATNTNDNEEGKEEEAARNAAAADAFARNANRALGSSALASQLALLRRSALGVVAQLFEQFPEDIMAAMETTSSSLLYPTTTADGGVDVGGGVDGADASLFGRYIIALFENSRGVTHDGAPTSSSAATRTATFGGKRVVVSAAAAIANRSNKSYVTPVLRLIASWSHSTALLPLFPLFSGVVVGTFGEVFAVNTGNTTTTGVATGSPHRASALALREGLGCLNDLLSMREEQFPLSYLTRAVPGLNDNNTSNTQKKKRAKRAAAAAAAVNEEEEAEVTEGMTTFGSAFLAPYVVPIFAALYRLVVRGADGDAATAKTIASSSTTATATTAAADEEEAAAKRVARKAKAAAATTTSTSTAGQSSRSIMSFKIPMWKEIMQTTSLLSTYITESTDVKQQLAAAAGGKNNSDDGTDGSVCNNVGTMLSRLAEVALHVTTHPACVADTNTALVALEVVDKLLREVPDELFDLARHFRPLVHLTNVMTLPASRLRLCATLRYVLANKTVVSPAAAARQLAIAGKPLAESDSTNDSTDNGDSAAASAAAFAAQLAAVGRAIACLNSFDNGNENLSRYDFELRYHTFNSLLLFFNNKGNYGALAATSGRRGGGRGGNSINNASSMHSAATTTNNVDASGGGGIDNNTNTNGNDDGNDYTISNAVRKEREYSGELDVRIPVDAQLAPVLCAEGFYALAASVTFLLRDPESTIRALAVQLTSAMLRYAATATIVAAGPNTAAAASQQRRRHKNNKEERRKDEGEEEEAEEGQQEQEEQSAPAAQPVPFTTTRATAVNNAYAQLILEEVVRKELLPSLRRGVVAKDVNIRTDHMVAFGGLGRYYAGAFPSFATLYSPNTEQNFFQNVGHVQPKCRLHALAILRREATSVNVRDLLRVFVPFLMSAVKDFAQGKRDLRNLTETKAKGYCDAVLMTIAAITQKLPWEAYHRVLTLFLANAAANPSLRMPMLRGVVQVLNNFTFLDDDDDASKDKKDGKNIASAKATTATTVNDDDDDDEDAEGDEAVALLILAGGDGAEAADPEAAAALAAEVRARRRFFRNKRIMDVLEEDILPQLFDFIGDGGSKNKKALDLSAASGGADLKGGHQNTITSIRRAQHKEDKAASNTKNAILQLPVAIAITKIVKKFPEDKFNVYVDHILDEVIVKLRTKNDKHRESARRILSAVLKETGPGKLRFVLTKLKDNLVHGYQLHVLGYTVVTLLYQLYEPQHALLHADGSGHIAGYNRGKGSGGGKSASHGGDDDENDINAAGGSGDPVAEALNEAKRLRRQQQLKKRRRTEDGSNSDDDDSAAAAAGKKKAANKKVDPNDTRTAAERAADDEVEAAEEDLLAQLMPYYQNRAGTGPDTPATGFTHAYGVACLMDIMDDLMRVFLDDYLGEVGAQKEQTELMSTMVEVKRNRSLQGFSFLARHCEAGRVMEVFLQRITWVLTPPSDPTAAADASKLHGSERARALIVQEMKSKYMSVSKNAGADLVFVNKVRLLATRVARGIMTNPSMQIESAFTQVRDLLDRHNAVREEKIRAFEARDGTRRIRGSAHIVLHAAKHDSWKEQLDRNFLVAAVPERVDVDFSSHTVLATQQKQKLRVYKGRYGKQVQEAARDFYREDPTTAVVLDTLDEFLMKFLLSVLKRVLGIGKEKRYSAAAVQLDLLRRRKARQASAKDDNHTNDDDDDDEAQADDEEEEEGASDAANSELDDADEEDEEEKEGLDPQDLDEDSEDELDEFADAQQAQADDDKNKKKSSKKQQQGSSDDDVDVDVNEDGAADPTTDDDASPSPLIKRGRKKAVKLSISFTTEHRALLESLVPSVLATLQGEGSDPVIANALDCLLALVSLRPPLSAVGELNANLFSTVTGFFGRGGSIKQRAMRVCAAVIAHQPFQLADEQAGQLVRLVRAEVMDRSAFLPMALSLFYAVLGKHSHVSEVYDLIDIVTELMVHLSAKSVIVRKCIMILVRFLTEFRLTTDKFRSHIDLLYKNLDYPELAGRMALLECLDTLVSRLPVVVLRRESSVLLVPLAATVTSCEWKQCRERAGRVLQSISRFAGIDVLVPMLSAWLGGEASSRPQRAMAAQVWATIVPALARAYRVPDATAALSARRSSGSNSAYAAGAEDVTEEEKAAYLASCEWSLSGILDGCLFDQFKAAGIKIKTTHKPSGGSVGEEPALAASMAGVSKKDRAAAELKGWTFVFYSLRCAESMLFALPDAVYPLLGPRLLPAIVDRLVTHAHPWVQAVSLRILRHYCFTYVEQRCQFLQEPAAPSLARLDPNYDNSNTTEGDDDAVDDVVDGNGCGVSLPFILAPLKATGTTTTATPQLLKDDVLKVWAPSAERTLAGLLSLLKALLSRVGLSDIANEHQRAHRELAEDQSRTESLKIMVFVSKAISHTATSLLVATSPSSSGRLLAGSGYQKQVKARLQTDYAGLYRHIRSLVRPVLDQKSVTNYVIRTATLVQFFGGYVSVLPAEVLLARSSSTGAGADHDNDHDEEDRQAAAAAASAVFSGRPALVAELNAAARWLLADGGHALAFTQRTARPLMNLAFSAGRSPQHKLLNGYAHQATTVVKQQLEERRQLFSAVAEADHEENNNGSGGGGEDDDETTTTTTSGGGMKRARAGGDDESSSKRRRLSLSGPAAVTSPTTTTSDPSLDTVLAQFSARLARLKEERKEQQIVTDTKRQLKRNRREMEREEEEAAAGGGMMKKSKMAALSGGGKTQMAVKKRFPAMGGGRGGGGGGRGGGRR